MLRLNILTVSKTLWRKSFPLLASNLPKVYRNDLLSRTLSASSQNAVIVEDSFIKKFFKSVGWMDHTKTRLKLSGYLLYETVPDKVVYNQWLESCELPDTFTTWFAITELHVWLLMVRCMADDLSTVTGDTSYIKDGDGRYMRNCIVEALWADVGNRIKLLEGANPSIARKQVSELSEQFQAALMSYDEGLSDDRVLAGALWRRLFQMSEVDAQNVEKVIKFLRMQLVALDKVPSDSLKRKPDIQWLSVDSV